MLSPELGANLRLNAARAANVRFGQQQTSSSESATSALPSIAEHAPDECTATH